MVIKFLIPKSYWLQLLEVTGVRVDGYRRGLTWGPARNGNGRHDKPGICPSSFQNPSRLMRQTGYYPARNNFLI